MRTAMQHYRPRGWVGTCDHCWAHVLNQEKSFSRKDGFLACEKCCAQHGYEHNDPQDSPYLKTETALRCARMNTHSFPEKPRCATCDGTGFERFSEPEVGPVCQCVREKTKS